MAKKPADNTPVEPWMTELTEGHSYFVRTARYDYVGRLLKIKGQYSMTLCSATLVMSTGRYHEFVRDGTSADAEIEPIFTPGGIVTMQWLDWTPWIHKLPTEVK